MNENKFCKNCGKQISADFKLCPYCGEKVEEDIVEIQCQSCGKTIKSDFKVCPYCGNNPNNKKENHNNYDMENRENYYSNNSNNYRESYNDYSSDNTESRRNYYSSNYEISPKSGVVCLILLIFLYPFHRFYAGKIGSGIVMLILGIIFIISIGILSELSYYDEVGTAFAGGIMFITAIILFVCGIIDLVSILRGKFKDSRGRYIKLKN